MGRPGPLVNSVRERRSTADAALIGRAGPEHEELEGDGPGEELVDPPDEVVFAPAGAEAVLVLVEIGAVELDPARFGMRPSAASRNFDMDKAMPDIVV
jgi:hypothetical protein